MQLTIEQIKKVITAYNKMNKTSNQEIKELVNMFIEVIVKQTSIKKIEDLKKILALYDSYKENDWFKKGLEEVLLYGRFPYNESIKYIPGPNIYPTKQWPGIGDPLIPDNPLRPIVTYCVNGTKFNALECFGKIEAFNEEI